MTDRRCAGLLLVLGLSLVCFTAAEELKLDEALLSVRNHLPDAITLLYVSDYCYQCLFQPLLTVPSANSSQPANNATIISTRFTLTIQVMREGGSKDPVCSWKQLYGEHGKYIISVHSSLMEQENGTVKCDTVLGKQPSNAYLPLLVAFGVLLFITGLYYFVAYIIRLGCTQRFIEDFGRRTSYVFSNESALSQEQNAAVPKPKRLLSLDTFRGFSLTVMVFCNYGGGGYWFFQHAPWNGLTIADLVMPWFVFIIGTSVALAFSSMRKKGVHLPQLLRKLTWRTCVLMAIGVFFINYGPADGPLSWRWARIPGVLQRLGFTYFVVAFLFACFSKQNSDIVESHQWSAAVRDIVTYWPEWIIMIALETVSLCLTFLLPVPGCPTGYLGPGGIGSYGQYPNCTGGAAGYIDKWLLGANHIYRYPSCMELASLSEQLTKIESELRTAMSLEEFNKCKEMADESINKYRCELETRKRSKFDRDIEDYERNQVYRWPRPYNRRGRSDYGSHRREISDNSSANTDTDSSSNFLQADRRERSTTRMQTRSRYNREESHDRYRNTRGNRGRPRET